MSRGVLVRSCYSGQLADLFSSTLLARKLPRSRVETVSSETETSLLALEKWHAVLICCQWHGAWHGTWRQRLALVVPACSVFLSPFLKCLEYFYFASVLLGFTFHAMGIETVHLIRTSTHCVRVLPLDLFLSIGKSSECIINSVKHISQDHFYVPPRVVAYCPVSRRVHAQLVKNFTTNHIKLITQPDGAPVVILESPAVIIEFRVNGLLSVFTWLLPTYSLPLSNSNKITTNGATSSEFPSLYTGIAGDSCGVIGRVTSWL
ncbi:hypothetical protein BKA64DRAFT_396832 [Cadophora sp. MPI-SDFR-AT-0126]|nr:hypothetical protein BKA64DRAFT_396832 [Leotiomycetes sp. MPI-SDFR-AT-0126]